MKTRTFYPSLAIGCLALFLSACGSNNGPATFSNATKLSNSVNSAESVTDAGAEVSDDHLTLYFQSNRSSSSGGFDIYASTRASTADAWGTATNVSALNSTSNERGPTISADGLTMIFGSDRAGGQGGMDLWASTRASTADAWGAPANIGATVNTSANESGPSLSSDALTLYFHSDRAGGSGNDDIYVATRAFTTDPWGAPTNLGATVNSADFDTAPEISSDGLTLYFQSTRAGGVGSHDIWVATRATTASAWMAPTAMTSPVNSTVSDVGASISSDGNTLYFSTDRTGSDIREIWQVTR